RLGGGSTTITNRASSITFDPAHPGAFWESGTYGEGGAVYETLNKGATFAQLGSATGLGNTSDDVSIDLTDPSRRTMLAVGHEGSYLYRSLNGGATWVDLASSLPTGAGWTVAPVAVDAGTYLVGT